MMPLHAAAAKGGCAVVASLAVDGPQVVAFPRRVSVDTPLPPLLASTKLMRVRNLGETFQ